MNRCKLCDAPVLESRNRRQLASTTSQHCRAVLMGLAIETTKKKKESGSEYESVYKVLRLDQEVLGTARKIGEHQRSKISLRCTLIKWNSPILS